MMIVFMLFIFSQMYKLDISFVGKRPPLNTAAVQAIACKANNSLAWPTLTRRGGSGQTCIPSSYKTARVGHTIDHNYRLYSLWPCQTRLATVPTQYTSHTTRLWYGFSSTHNTNKHDILLFNQPSGEGPSSPMSSTHASPLRDVRDCLSMFFLPFFASFVSCNDHVYV